MLMEKTETSVKRVSTFSAVKAPRMASTPMSRGSPAATTPPKITTSSTITIGSDSDSARAMSSDTWVLMSSLSTRSPPRSTSSPDGAAASASAMRS
jgi:hypothetical protein